MPILKTRLLASKAPKVGGLATGGAPVPPPSSPVPAPNPYQQPLNNGASLVDSLIQDQINQRMSASQPQGQPAPPAASPPMSMGGAPPMAQGSIGQIPQLDQSMFQNPGYDPKRLQALQRASDILLQQATGGQYNQQTGQLSTRGKIQKYGDAAGQILQGLGGIGAAFGPDGAAKGFNTYLEQAQKRAEDRRKAEADNRKEAIKGLTTLTDLMANSGKTTTENIKNILDAHKAEAAVNQDNAGTNLKKAQTDTEKEAAQTQKAKTVAELLGGVRQGAAGQAETAKAVSQEALAGQRDAAAGLNQSKAKVEDAKVPLTNAKTDIAKAQQGKIGAATEGIKKNTELTGAKIGLVGQQAKTQGTVQNLNTAKTEAIYNKAQADIGGDKQLAAAYKALPPGAVDHPTVKAAIAKLKEKGQLTAANLAYVVNKAKGLPEYASKKGASSKPALKPFVN